jgi:dihydrofolate reductase
MASLIYAVIASLDGYVADADGNFDWAEPDEEVHAFANELDRPIGTHLYGRRMYEVMSAWAGDEMLIDQPPVIHDYAAIWRAADKIVFSRTLDAAWTERTRLERVFGAAAVRELKAQADRDISIGGPHLAAEALRAGLVDEIHLLVSPVVVGSGNRALPDGVRLDLELAGERRFGNGVVHLQYRVTNDR